MIKEYHILNGDALLEQLPKSIPGEFIVARECLVDGDVKGDSLEELYKTRATFLSTHYQGVSQTDYYEGTVKEFEKIVTIPNNAVINLWFEDDLFCQVNFWFVAYLLKQTKTKSSIYLIRPKTHTQYGFGGLDSSGLISIYDTRTRLTNLNELASLWEAYQKNNIEELFEISENLNTNYPFITEAVKAHNDRMPSDGNTGRPKATLLQIMEDLNTQEFSAVFREFCKREPIYGYGDTQVKRLLDEIIHLK